MICPSCGAQNHADFSFCLQCGHPLAQSGTAGEPMGETRADMMPVEAGTMAMSAIPASPAGMSSGGGPVRLRVDQGSVDEQFISLDRPITVIGRRQGSDVVIHDTNVSRMHAQIKREGTRLLIEDSNSSNGTIVNDERIERACELRPGDVIRIGDAVFVFEVEAEEEPYGATEGSTMAIDLDSPMTSLGGAPELIAPGLVMPHPSPLTPPPAIMDSGHTALGESMVYEDELAPPPRRAVTPLPAPAPISQPVAPSPVPFVAPSFSDLVSGCARVSTADLVDAVALALVIFGRRVDHGRARFVAPGLAQVGQELGEFSGTLGGLADRVERLERALDAATGDLASVADAIRGPDASVLKELQGILADIERAAEGPPLDEAVKVLEQLSAQPRDIELLLKLSQQAGAIESALRIHGRLVAAAPGLRSTLARLTG